MRATIFLIGFAIVTASCSSGPSTQFVTFGSLSFMVPSGWQSRTLSDQHTARVMWTPADNAAKESLVIIHTSPRAAAVKAGPDHVEKLLDQAQRSLARGRFGAPKRFRNEFGLAGVRIEGSFVPPGQTEPYQRIHAVIFDPQLKSFVHVLYTAKVADREAFDVVVDSLSKRGA